MLAGKYISYFSVALSLLASKCSLKCYNLVDFILSVYFIVILYTRFTECDDYHYGFNCKQTCFCQHGVCNKIKGGLIIC